MLILIVLLIRWRKTFSSTLQRSMYPFGYILHIDQSMSILTNIVMEVAMFYFYHYGRSSDTLADKTKGNPVSGSPLTER